MLGSLMTSPGAKLIEMGYDSDQVDTLEREHRWRREEEDNSRKEHDHSWTRRRQHHRQKEQEEVTLYRTWAWLDMTKLIDGQDQTDPISEEGLSLYEIHWSSGEVLHKNGEACIYEADQMPFFEWTEHKISHAEHGMATSDVVAHTQKTNSGLKRLVYDNQQMANNPRLEAISQRIKNPRELLDAPIGSIVWNKSGQLGAVQAPGLARLVTAHHVSHRDVQAGQGGEKWTQSACAGT